MFGIECFATPRELLCPLFLGRLEWKVMGSGMDHLFSSVELARSLLGRGICITAFGSRNNTHMHIPDVLFQVELV
jgi:hypothetical protein